RSRARALLDPLRHEIPPGPLRASVLLNLADFSWDEPTAGELAEQALAEVGTDDSCRARLHMLLSAVALEGEDRSAVGHIRAACADEFLAEVECRLGNVEAATAHASECAELYQQLGMANWPAGLYASALVHAYLGNVEEARAAAELGAAIGAEIGKEFWAIAN